jgi:hypothetical protein
MPQTNHQPPRLFLRCRVRAVCHCLFFLPLFSSPTFAPAQDQPAQQPQLTVEMRQQLLEERKRLVAEAERLDREGKLAEAIAAGGRRPLPSWIFLSS